MARVRGVMAASIASGDTLRASLDIDEDRGAARVVDGAGGGKERERRRDHLVAWREVKHLERQQERVGAAGAGDAMRHAGHLCKPLLELSDFRPHNKGLAGNHPHDRWDHLVLDPLVLSDEVKERHTHGFIPQRIRD
jgi:hypothetical protein